MAGKRGSAGDSVEHASDSEADLKAELLARLSRLSYRELLTLTLDHAFGARSGEGLTVRDSRSLGVAEAQSAYEVDWSKVDATCPKCGKHGKVDPEFGLIKKPDGSMRKQSWCRDCRNGTSYHKTLAGAQAAGKAQAKQRPRK